MKYQEVYRMSKKISQDKMLKKTALMPPSRMLKLIAQKARSISNNPIGDIFPGSLLLPFVNLVKIQDPQLLAKVKHSQKLGGLLLKYTTPGIVDGNIGLVSSLRQGQPLRRNMRALINTLNKIE